LNYISKWWLLAFWHYTKPFDLWNYYIVTTLAVMVKVERRFSFSFCSPTTMSFLSKWKIESIFWLGQLIEKMSSNYFSSFDRWRLLFSLSKVHSINFLYLNLDFFQDEIVEGDEFMKERLILNFTSRPNRVVLQAKQVW